MDTTPAQQTSGGQRANRRILVETIWPASVDLGVSNVLATAPDPRGRVL